MNTKQPECPTALEPTEYTTVEANIEDIGRHINLSVPDVVVFASAIRVSV